ncbi:hypothetical protein H0H92_007727 [Tricholoma furcatifolium]|nr:hypothetical protein H0H92_007727 [Tricholoma furcatifolium]
MAEIKRPLPSDDSFEEGVAKKLKNENDDNGGNSVTVTVHSSNSLFRYIFTCVGNVTTAFEGIKPKSVKHRRIIKALQKLYEESNSQLPYKTGHIEEAFELTITRPGCEYKKSVSEADTDFEYLKTWFDNATISGYGDNRARETKVDSTVRDAREITADEFQRRSGQSAKEFSFRAPNFVSYPIKFTFTDQEVTSKHIATTPEMNLVGTFLLGLGDTCPDDGCFTIGEEKLRADVGHWVAFYPDIPHAISPLPDDSYRAVLAFKVFRDGDPAEAHLISREVILHQRVEDVVNSIPRPFGIILDHDYCMGTTQPNGYDAILLAAVQQRKDSIIHFMPVVLESDAFLDCTGDDDAEESTWRTSVYPFLPAHIEIANRRATPETERTIKVFSEWENVPFFCHKFNRRAVVWSREEELENNTGNEYDSRRETTIYLSHALLVLLRPGFQMKDMRRK